MLGAQERGWGKTGGEEGAGHFSMGSQASPLAISILP